MLEALSEDAWLLRFGDTIDVATNARVQAAAHALRAAALPGVIDIAPAYASLLLRLAMGSGSYLSVDALRDIIDAVPESFGKRQQDPGPHRDGEADARRKTDSPVIDIPVCYDDAFAPDLDAVVAHAGLPRQTVIANHTAAVYTVAMLGFAPGFPYLLGLDPALHVPRRASPRTRVPAGSVAIGGAQTGIYPRELPGGWNLIGRTPVSLFDPTRDTPALLAPGDRVRFRAIDAEAFARLAEQQA